MTLVSPWPSLRQALIRRLRSNLVLKGGLPGDWTEAAPPQKVAYPFGILQLHYSPVEYDWSGLVAIVGFDAVIFSKVEGEASNLAQLVFTTLQDAALDVTGQTSILCRFISGISMTDTDADGSFIYQSGGIYEARLRQVTPANRSLTITADSDIA